MAAAVPICIHLLYHAFKRNITQSTETNNNETMRNCRRNAFAATCDLEFWFFLSMVWGTWPFGPLPSAPDVAVPYNGVAAQPVRRHRRWAVGVAAGPTRCQPSHRRRQRNTPLCLLCCAFCSALGDCFLFLYSFHFRANFLVTLP